MKRISIYLLLLMPVAVIGQTDTSKWLRAFPITDYMVDLNDSTKIVQLEMPDGLTVKDKQIGLLYGVYNGSKDEAVQKGYGRCNLIKGNYYYFTIGNNKTGLALKKGDLIYTHMEKTSIYYGNIPELAGHFIRLLDVYEQPFYDRYLVFNNWTANDETKIVDSMVADIRFTGKYFLENNPGMEVPINSGKYKGQKTLQVMTSCKAEDLKDFFKYISARPRLYAGREWKVSEIFATWLSEGAPTVVKD